MTGTPITNRAKPPAVALETTLIIHGFPPAEAPALVEELSGVVRSEGADPAYIGIYKGRATVGLDEGEIREMLGAVELGETIAKVNTSTIGALMFAEAHAATTVSATMELAADASVRVFATGGLGGVHPGAQFDVSADLFAFTRFPVAVVTSGCKSILDVVATREALETLGVPVVGYRTDRFPAFYVRESDAGVDVRFDDVEELAKFVRFELDRTGRGIVVANPVPEEHALDETRFNAWLDEANDAAQRAGVRGRDVTPFVLAQLHERSGGATMTANRALALDNARLAARIANAIEKRS